MVILQQVIFAFCRQGLVPVLLVGQFQAILGLSWVSIYQSGAELQGAFPVLSPEKLALLVGSVVRPNVCPQAITGAEVGLACMVIFPSTQDKIHFGMVLALGGVACTLPG